MHLLLSPFRSQSFTLSGSQRRAPIWILLVLLLLHLLLVLVPPPLLPRLSSHRWPSHSGRLLASWANLRRPSSVCASPMPRPSTSLRRGESLRPMLSRSVFGVTLVDLSVVMRHFLSLLKRRIMAL